MEVVGFNGLQLNEHKEPIMGEFISEGKLNAHIRFFLDEASFEWVKLSSQLVKQSVTLLHHVQFRKLIGKYCTFQELLTKYQTCCCPTI